MSDVSSLAQLGSLVAVHHGWPAAKAFKAYVATDADKVLVAKKAVDLLRIFPKVPDSGPALSAAYGAYLEKAIDAPVHVVTGTLKIRGEAVLGGDRPFDGAAASGSGQSDRDGHSWVMIGPYVADISIFRIAYAPEGPTRLTRQVHEMFGPNKGLIFDKWRHTRQIGFDYRPRHVLSTGEVDALLRDAHRLIESHAAMGTGGSGG